MSDDLLNILSQSNKDIDNQMIMDYLANRMSAEEKHAFEEALLESELLDDAVEGLAQLKDKTGATLLAERLNKNLQKQLKEKRKRKEKRKLKELSWIYFFIAAILIIIIISMLAIHFLQK